METATHFHKRLKQLRLRKTGRTAKSSAAVRAEVAGLQSGADWLFKPALAN